MQSAMSFEIFLLAWVLVGVGFLAVEMLLLGVVIKLYTEILKDRHADVRRLDRKENDR